MQRIETKKEYDSQYEHSTENRLDYWDQVAGDYTWFSKWTSVQTGSFEDVNVRWFDGAKLNITVNCLDRHLKNQPQKTALIFEPNDPTDTVKTYSYKELHEEVCRFANILKSKGIKKGDVVCFYMAMVPELMIGILACARIGAIHSVVFGGFSALALEGRINDCSAKLLVTNDGGMRGQKLIELKAIADEALENCNSIDTVIVVNRVSNQISMKENRDFWYHELINEVSDSCEAEVMDAEDPLFILYTSGSTGKPKGLVHTTAGYMVQVGHHFKSIFPQEQNDIYWCTADIGWVTGHSYITYGPLLNGATTLMFEGVPTFPDAGRFWQVIDKHQVTHLYTAPTAIRSLEACGLEFVKPYKLSSLKVLGSVGEPINEEAWHWYHKNIGKENCPIVDTWWQTETGGIMITPIPNVTKLIPAHATKPLPGIVPVLMDENGAEINNAEGEGRLCIKHPWPSMARTIFGDHQRFKDTYFSTFKGYYFTGDGAKRDADLNYRITGRVDDIIIVSGHNIGTAEVEDALNEHPSVVESAVVGYPHKVKGQAIYAYVICSGDISAEDQFHKELMELVNKMVGPIARPEKIQLVTGLPKTRSGKIMRRILRKIAAGEDSFGDTSTLLNPEVVEEIRKKKLG